MADLEIELFRCRSDNFGVLLHDPVSGKTLWEHQLATGVATPISYELDGKQYIAVMSGMSKGRMYGFALDAKETMPQ